jgi:hypothetical protein
MAIGIWYAAVCRLKSTSVNIKLQHLGFYTILKFECPCHQMKKIFFALLLIIAISSQAQKSIYKGLPSLVWPKLYAIEYRKEGDNDKPLFSKDVQSIANKVITLPGYMVPFESGMKGTHFMLSSLPLNACFFCGVGGPETIVEVFLAEAISYTDKPVEIRGKLILNDKNPDRMFYILEKAEFLGAVDF